MIEEYIESLSVEEDRSRLSQVRRGLTARDSNPNKARRLVGGAIAECRMGGVRKPHVKEVRVGKFLAEAERQGEKVGPLTRGLFNTRLSGVDGFIYRLARLSVSMGTGVNWVDVFYSLLSDKNLAEAQRRWASDYFEEKKK